MTQPAILVASRKADDEHPITRALYAGWSPTRYGQDGYVALLRPSPTSFPTRQQADRLRSFGGIRVVEDPTVEEMAYVVREYGGDA